MIRPEWISYQNLTVRGHEQVALLCEELQEVSSSNSCTDRRPIFWAGVRSGCCETKRTHVLFSLTPLRDCRRRSLRSLGPATDPTSNVDTPSACVVRYNTPRVTRRSYNTIAVSFCNTAQVLQGKRQTLTIHLRLAMQSQTFVSIFFTRPR